MFSSVPKADATIPQSAIHNLQSTARQCLNDHLAEKGAQIFAKYGPRIGWNELLRLLEDRTCVRYPCVIEFDDAQLEPGEFAYPAAKGERPEDGFTMYVHPLFMTQLDQVPLLVLYQLVLVNYGAFATPDDAETFGAAAVGLPKNEYYAALCDFADLLSGVFPGQVESADRG